MNYILKVTTRYNNSEVNTARSWAFTTYEGACKKMIENLESLNRQLMVTELTDVTGYTIELREWVTGNTIELRELVTGNKYKQVAKINYDLAL